MEKGGRAARFEDPIAWLEAAEIVHINRQTVDEQAPLMTRGGNYFKLYMADTGLMFKKYDLAAEAFLDNTLYNNLSSRFRGALAENYVMQALVANGIKPFYWANKGLTSEIDFIFSDRFGQVVPLEVKSGKNVQSASLGKFPGISKAPYAMRLSMNNFGFENNIFSVPLYAAFCINASV